MIILLTGLCKKLTSGNPTLLKAAEMAHIDIWFFIEKLKKEKVKWVGLSPEDAKKDFNVAGLNQ